MFFLEITNKVTAAAGGFTSPRRGKETGLPGSDNKTETDRDRQRQTDHETETDRQTARGLHLLLELICIPISTFNWVWVLCVFRREKDMSQEIPPGVSLLSFYSLNYSL